MNSSVTATEMLKFERVPGSFLDVMNSTMSGWSTLKTPIIAPLLFPPAFMTSVAVSKTRMKLTGPDATPIVDMTISPFGLSLEKSKPTPPPLFSIKAMFFTASKMLSKESSMGKAKHADN